MASNPRNVGGFGKGDCRDGTVPPASGAYTGLIEKGDCEDCRLSRVEDVKVVHFTICQKPWECHGTSTSCYYCKICNQFHRKWFEIRASRAGAYQSVVRPGKRRLRRKGSYNKRVTSRTLSKPDLILAHFRGSHHSGRLSRGD